MDTYYTPRNVVVAGMNALMMRRRFAKTVDGLLRGLRALAEVRALSAGLEKRSPRSDLQC
jgi:hypothetical protein